MASNTNSNKVVLAAFAVICSVTAGLLAVWVILQEDAATSTVMPAPRAQVPIQPHPFTTSELEAPALNAITLPSLEQRQTEAEAVRKAEIATAMEKTRVEKEAALKKQREKQRRQQEAEGKAQPENPDPSLLEDKAKDPSTPQTPATCSESDRVASAPVDERYNTLIGNKIPVPKNSEMGTCTVQTVPR